PRVVVLDAGRGTALREVSYGIAPQACAPARRRGRLFVTDSATDLLAELDLEAGAVVSERVTGPFPYGVTLAAGDQRALVASVFGASVRVFDLPGGAAWDLALGPDAMPQFGARTADGDVVF